MFFAGKKREGGKKTKNSQGGCKWQSHYEQKKKHVPVSFQMEKRKVGF